jgi:hypothetical protein
MTPEERKLIMDRAMELANMCVGAWVAEIGTDDPAHPLLSDAVGTAGSEAWGNQDLFQYLMLAFALLSGGAVERAALAEDRPAGEVFEEVAVECARLALGE